MLKVRGGKRTMPKLTNKSRPNYEEQNDVRRNLKHMTLEEQERYVHGESLRAILGDRFRYKKLR